MTTDTQDITEEPKVTVGELGKLTDALAADLEKHSKTTLLLYLASRVVWDAYFRHGTIAAVSQAHADVLDEMKTWAKTGRMVNQGKRLNSMMKRHDETMAAIREGRPLPKKKRKRRAAPKRKTPWSSDQ